MRFFLPVIALAALAVPAAAENVTTVRIGYGDIDVTTAEGRAALEARIDERLRKACALDGTVRYGYGRAVADAKCIADAKTAALAQVRRVVASKARGVRTVAAN